MLASHVLVELIRGNGRQTGGGTIGHDLGANCWTEDKEREQTAAERSPITSNEQVDFPAQEGNVVSLGIG
jgi:hypothetical protein